MSDASATRGSDEASGSSRGQALALRVRDLMLRTEQSAILRPLWTCSHELFLRGVARALRGRERAGVYVKGTFAWGEPVFGISDIDLIVVVAEPSGRSDGSRARVKENCRRLCRRFPLFALLVDQVWVYGQAELASVMLDTCLTRGLGTRGASAGRTSAPAPPKQLADEAWLLWRPGLVGAEEWRLLSGPDLRPPKQESSRQHQRLAAWLELQFWWRYVGPACADPGGRHVPFLCVKLVAEPTRIWLLLARGEHVFSRRALLELALKHLPEEEAALRIALALHNDLPRSPAAPLDRVLPFLVRMSRRIARLVADEIAEEGTTQVRILGREEASPLALRGSTKDHLGRATLQLPLIDWRAIVMPEGNEDRFTLVPGHPGDPKAVRRAFEAAHQHVYPALQSDELLVFPARSPWHANGRAVKSPAGDPVPFALLAGAETAAFPNVPGWSARDTALRAVAEHREWLSANADDEIHAMSAPDARQSALLMLFSAARAALFLESVERREPELTLTATATAERLRATDASLGEIAQSALLAKDKRDPDRVVAAAFARAVRTLPPYAGGTTAG